MRLSLCHTRPEKSNQWERAGTDAFLQSGLRPDEGLGFPSFESRFSESATIERKVKLEAAKGRNGADQSLFVRTEATGPAQSNFIQDVNSELNPNFPRTK